MPRRVAPKGNTYGLVHGYAPKNKKRPPIYRRWQRLIQRCHNPNDKDYKNYGGRGITVCDKWRKSFTAFLADMGLPPSPKHTIDRIDNMKGYSPDNCRWATPAEQANNTRRTRYLTVDGVTRPIAAWASLVGISNAALRNRVDIQKMPHKEAVYTPLTWTKKEKVK